MTFRGDDEPEYIDDDEYFDPDDFGREGHSGDAALGASGSPSSSALGASGARKSDIGDSGQSRNRSQNSPANSAPGSVRGSTRGRTNRPAKGSRNSKATKQRNAGDAQRSGRRAKDNRDKPGNQQRAEGSEAKPGRKWNFSRLRRPIRRNKANNAPKGRSKTSEEKRAGTRFAALSGRISSLRRRLAFRKSSEENATKRSPRETSEDERKRTIRSAFGASREETRKPRRDMKPAAAASARMDRDAGDGEHASPGSHTRPSKAPVFKSSDWLDLDRKLDLVGVGLVFGAIVLFFSALSQEQAAIGAVHNLIGQLLGWGALAVPISMFAIGMWLIVRHFGDQAPMIDPVRLAGAVAAFIGVLILLQFVESFSYGQFIARGSLCGHECVRVLVQNSYEGGRGGGLIGGWSYQILVNNFTEIGGFIVVVMVLTFATMMITRLSMAELAALSIGIGRSLRSKMAQQAAKRRARHLQAEQQRSLAQQETTVRVSKPAAAKLPGAMPAGALPEPSGDTMAIPNRLRDLFSRRVGMTQAAAEVKSDAAAVEARAASVPHRQGPRLLGRFFGRGAGAAMNDHPEIPAAETNGAAAADAKNSPDNGQRNLRGTRPRSSSPASSIEPQALTKPGFPQPTPFPTPSAPAPAPPSATPKIEPDSAAPNWEPQDSDAQPPDPSDKGGKIVASKAPPAEKQTPTPSLPEDPFDTAIEASDPTIELPDAPEPTDEDLPDEVLKAAPKNLADAPTEPQYLEQPDKKQAPVSTGPVNQTRPRVDWQLPDFHALLTGGSTSEMDQEALLRQAQVIEDTLASFGAPGRVIELNTGPVITQFGVEPYYLTSRAGKRSRVKVSAIAQLDKDLQLALGAKSIRVEAPVPGKGYVGIEVPNPDSAMVSLRDVMESLGFQQVDSPLAIALGMSVDGKPMSADLTQMPHLLIAGTTGSGKSKCINAIIISILANRSPDEVKFIMVDPKRVELTGYNGLPHLVAPVVVELERTVGVLRWVTREMDARYKKFSQAGARNIIDYNRIHDGNSSPMPYIVVIIDELADLMMTAPEETERAISRIAALARATGIHLVIATQRPSVDVVTGLIKANFPARIAFAVAGSVDSRVILDQPGAERLLGKGDMLYLSGDAPAPMRMQGVFVSDEEINIISRFWKLQNAGVAGIKPISLPAETPSSRGQAGGNKAQDRSNEEQPDQAAFWDMSSQRDLTGLAVEDKTGNPDPQEDELYETAVEMVRRLEKASISLLQRRLRIGYTRAARLIDMMEERGVVGPPKEGSSKPRDVLPG